jgi:hypothetical protein
VYYFDPTVSGDGPIRHYSVVYGSTSILSSWSAFIRPSELYPPRSRNVGERCRDSTSIEAFSHDSNDIIKTVFVPVVYRVATEEHEKACARVKPGKSSYTVPLVIALALDDEIRELVPVASGSRTLGAPLAMDFSMADGPPASHNINYVHS